MPVIVDDVKSQLAAALHLADPTALKPFWSVIAPQALGKALSELNAVLSARGLTTTQIATWPGADPWVLGQSIYHALTQGGGLEDVDMEAVKMMNGLESLQTMNLTDAAGVAIAGSGIGRGEIKEGFPALRKLEPGRRLGLIDSQGRLMRW